MKLKKKKIEEFFAYSRERYKVYLKKDCSDGCFCAPYTKDEILQQYRFCNVFREDDKVTKWFRSNIREPLRNDPRVLLATFAFRLFNLPATGENMLLWGDDKFDLFSTEGWHRHKDQFRTLVKAQEQKVTGAYMTKTPTGLDKTDGCIQVIDWFIEHCGGHAESIAQFWQSRDKSEDPTSLQEATEWMTQAPFMGPFLAYEVITDLRHTMLLENAPDIMTWANPGPGAARGLSRMCGVDKDTLKREKKADVEQMMLMMRQLLILSSDEHYWPQTWPSWEMREVEHTLCEFDKYERVRTGEGTPRSRYNGAG